MTLKSDLISLVRSESTCLFRKKIWKQMGLQARAVRKSKRKYLLLFRKEIFKNYRILKVVYDKLEH